MLSKLLTICLISVLTPSSSVVYKAAESLVLENHLSAVNPQNSDPLEDLLVVDEFKNNYLFGSYLSNPSLDNFDVIATLEYGYSPLETYNLYLYVFNQSGVENDYNFAFSGNRIEIFNESTGSYEHAPIKYVSISSDKKFIKYRLDVLNQDYTRVDGARQYGIVGIEIASIKNELNNVWALHDYAIGHSWIYTGTGGELQVDYASDFEYLELNVNVGVYQMGSTADDPFDKNNLFYSYFSVPKTFDGEAYSLYSVHADYYDFDMSYRFGALVDSRDVDYYMGIYNSIFDDGQVSVAEQSIIDNVYASNLGANEDDNMLAAYYFGKYATNSDSYHNPGLGDPEGIVADGYRSFLYRDSVQAHDGDFSTNDNLAIMFGVSNTNEIVSFDRVDQFLDVDNAEIISGQSRDDVYKNIHYTSDKNPINDAIYVDWDLLAYGDHHNDWDNFWSRLSGVDVDEASLENVPCIEKVNPDVLTNLDPENESQYLVESEDLTTFKNYYTAEQILLKDTYLFRFDTSVYSSIAMLRDYDYMDYFLNPLLPAPVCGYIVDSYDVAIDFDVIDLTFINDYEELLQIPVVADPHNVGSDLIPPSNNDGSWLVYLLMVVIGIIIAIIVLSKLSDLLTFSSSANTSRQVRSLRKEVRRSGSSNRGIKKRYKRKK